jgi:hypothetical protein
MRNYLFFLGMLLLNFVSIETYAQQGIGTTNPNASSILDVTSTSKGVLVPRMTNTQMSNISNPVAGLQVYNTTFNNIYTYNGSAWISEKKYTCNMVKRGDTVTFGNLMVRLPVSGNSSAQLAFKSGTVKVTGTSIYTNTVVTIGSSASANIGSYMRQSENFSSTFSYFQAGLNFNTRGNTQQIWFTDETNWKFYKISITAGLTSTYTTSIEIEEL